MFGSTAATRGGPNNDYIVPDVPQDTISSLSFGVVSDQSVLVGSSWTKDICVYTIDANTNIKKVCQTQATAPVLTTSVDSANKIVFFGGFDNKVNAWDINTNQQLVVGEHAAPVKALKFLSDMNILVSGGWDNTVKYWDVRQNTRQPIGQLSLPGKVYALDAHGPSRQLIVGIEQKRYAFVDLNNPMNMAKTGETTHELQTSCAAINPAGGYAIGSIEGRVHIEYVGARAAQSFPFRCHRATAGTVSEAYAVTSLNFHPKTGILATTGADGTYIFWDHAAKSKLKSFEKNDVPIACATFNHDGSLFAYAASYNWNKGYSCPQREKPHKIYVHVCNKTEVTSKAR